MKKGLILSSVVLALLLAGCSSKDSTVADENSNASQNANGANNAGSDNTVNVPTTSADAVSLANKISTIYFDFNKFNIKEDMKSKIDLNAKALKEMAVVKVKLEGNTDDLGTDEYNYALGLKRANAVKQALVSKGVKAANITTVSYGESNLVCKEQTDACRADNRRVNATPNK